MVAESGAVLLDDDARRRWSSGCCPGRTVVTPNIPEARALDGRGGERLAGGPRPRGAGAWARAVVVTGGHSEQVVDVFFDGVSAAAIHGRALPGRRRARLRLHALLGAGGVLRPATQSPAGGGRARQITEEAIRTGLREIGRRAGPVDVFDLKGSVAAIGVPGRPSSRAVDRVSRFRP